MNGGYIKLHRKILDSKVFQSEGLLKVFVWCLLKASHKEQWVSVKTGRGTTEVHLMPGQFIFGRLTAGKELKMHPETARKRIHKLKNMENCTIQSTNHYSVVAVTNWELYQQTPEEVPSKVPTKYQPSTTYKNVKNVKKKDKEEKYHQRQNVLLTKKEHEILIEKHGEQKTKWLLDKLSLAKETHGYKYKSDYGAINMWVLKAWEKEGGQEQQKQGSQYGPKYGSPEWKERYPE